MYMYSVREQATKVSRSSPVGYPVVFIHPRAKLARMVYAVTFHQRKHLVFFITQLAVALVSSFCMELMLLAPHKQREN